jgi:hypothetical protein
LSNEEEIILYLPRWDGRIWDGNEGKHKIPWQENCNNYGVSKREKATEYVCVQRNSIQLTKNKALMRYTFENFMFVSE